MKNLPKPSDAELLDSYQDGQLDAFDQLVERWQAPLIRFAKALRKRQDLAEDAVQETFMRLLRAAPKSGSFETLGPWLFRVCRNLCYDAMKSESRLSDREAKVAELPPPPTPELIAEGAEIGALVAQELDLLPEKEREALRLKLQAGLPYGEIAEVMGIAKGTVGWLVHQAMERLNKRLEAIIA